MRSDASCRRTSFVSGPNEISGCRALPARWPEGHAQPRGEARGKVEATKEHDLGGRGTMGKRAGVVVENSQGQFPERTRRNFTNPRAQ